MSIVSPLKRNLLQLEITPAKVIVAHEINSWNQTNQKQQQLRTSNGADGAGLITATTSMLSSDLDTTTFFDETTEGQDEDDFDDDEFDDEVV